MSSLLLIFVPHSIVIALPTIATAIVSLFLLIVIRIYVIYAFAFKNDRERVIAIVGRAITFWEAQFGDWQLCEEQYCEVKKWSIWYCTKNFILFLEAPILFSPTYLVLYFTHLGAGKSSKVYVFSRRCSVLYILSHGHIFWRWYILLTRQFIDRQFIDAIIHRQTIHRHDNL